MTFPKLGALKENNLYYIRTHTKKLIFSAISKDKDKKLANSTLSIHKMVILTFGGKK